VLKDQLFRSTSLSGKTARAGSRALGEPPRLSRRTGSRLRPLRHGRLASAIRRLMQRASRFSMRTWPSSLTGPPSLCLSGRASARDRSSIRVSRSATLDHEGSRSGCPAYRVEAGPPGSFLRRLFNHWQRPPTQEPWAQPMLSQHMAPRVPQCRQNFGPDPACLHLS
jgi:hypothetical protein